MQEIVLWAKPHKVADLLDGFSIKETPDSSYTAVVAINVDKGELFIQFRPSKKQAEAGERGPQFFYSPVDPLLLHQMQSAESVGKFFRREIQGTYKGTPINQLVFILVEPKNYGKEEGFFTSFFKKLDEKSK